MTGGRTAPAIDVERRRHGPRWCGTGPTSPLRPSGWLTDLPGGPSDRAPAASAGCCTNPGVRRWACRIRCRRALADGVLVFAKKAPEESSKAPVVKLSVGVRRKRGLEGLLIL